jgi:pSer/pThr/pTyr-binding forkhead associated (FHA) protein
LREIFPLEKAKPNRLPVMPRVLITVPEKNAQPYRFGIDRKTVTLGRGSENDIVIESGSVSVKHAEMRRTDLGYELVDLGSTNGMKHRGVRYDKVALVSGMSLRLGDVAFDFTVTEDELEAIASEMGIAETPPPVSASADIHVEESPEPDPEPAAEPKPKKKKPAPAARPAPQSSGISVGMIVLFLILAAAAFITGLSIRHKKETGETLIKAIVNKSDRVEKAAPPAEAPKK